MTIHSAEALEKKDISGLSDPYVAINYRNKKLKTKVCKKTLDPEWNETFLLDIEHNGDPKIELKVDINKFSNDMIHHKLCVYEGV